MQDGSLEGLADIVGIRQAAQRRAAVRRSSVRAIALYAGQIRRRSEHCAGGSQIAVPVGGPAMRGGPAALGSAQGAQANGSFVPHSRHLRRNIASQNATSFPHYPFRRRLTNHSVAMPKEATAFQLAMDRPSISQGTSSQRTTVADMICASNCSGLSADRSPPALQVAGPGHQPRSTPV